MDENKVELTEEEYKKYCKKTFGMLGFSLVKDAGLCAIVAGVIASAVTITNPLLAAAVYLAEGSIVTWLAKETDDAVMTDVNDVASVLNKPEIFTEEDKWRK
jgi:hypothetical protein